jgi:predicted small lipoprotein YifL
MRARGVVLVAAAAMLGAACGQRGPLYLPEEGNVVIRPAQTAAPGGEQPTEAPVTEPTSTDDDRDEPRSPTP